MPGKKPKQAVASRLRGAAAVLAAIALAGGFFWASRTVFAVRIHELQGRFELWRAGVREIELRDPELKGYLRDTCDPHDPEARGCVCVALLHGLGDEPGSWRRLLLAPARAWKKPVRLYAVSLPKSSRFTAHGPSEEYRARRQAEWLAMKLAPVCPSWVVVGNSLGAWVGAWLAIEGRIRVDKLVLVDGAGLKAAASDPSSRSSSPNLFSGEPTLESLKDFQRRAYFKPHPLPDAAWEHALEGARSAHLDQVLRAQTDEDYTEASLPLLRVPTMVVWGAADRVAPPEEATLAHSLIHGSSLRVIPECGHMPQKECPIPLIQAVNDMLGMGSM